MVIENGWMELLGSSPVICFVIVGFLEVMVITLFGSRKPNIVSLSRLV